MKQLLVLNPNCTAWMTDRVVLQLRQQLGGAHALRGLTAALGPPVIDSRESFEAGAQAGLRALQDALLSGPRPDAVLLACFGDPGLEALRALHPGLPIVGMAEAAMTQAAARGWRFAILTSGAAWGPMLQERAADFGLSRWLCGVHALPVNGKQLAEEPERWRAALQAAADAARAQGAQALILGGAAFAGLPRLIDTPLPLLDGLSAAAQSLQLDARSA